MLNKLNRLLFPFGDRLEGGELHLHADAWGSFDNGVGAIAADKVHMYSACGHHPVAGLQAVAVGGFLLALSLCGLMRKK